MTEAANVITSPWLGDIEWTTGCELLFPHGFPGFESERRMIPVEVPAQRPLVYLQSTGRGDVCFLALPVRVIDPAFELHLQEDEKAAIQLPEDAEPVIGTDVLCLGLLVPSGRTVQVNLNAPIVINLHNSTGIQCVTESARRGCFRLDENGRWENVC
jgi:flagellar assembly factor FliW